ncbi:magnesium/cobalt transporter CorA [Neisseriaceae bacterium ESL0693]|nr:magnesium/cobalt transporter CorA [Neisseriaceae bacterium ESL0693]
MSQYHPVSNARLAHVHNLPSLVHRSSIGDMPLQSLTVTVFNSERLEKHTYTGEDISVEHIPQPTDDTITWLHLVGISDSEQVRQLLKPFNIHDLVQEDLHSHEQRPKIEDYGHYLFLAARVFTYKKQQLKHDQVYLIISQNFIITFQFEPLGLFHIIRQYLKHNFFNIRHQKIDFFAYTFIDRIIDDYFVTIDEFDHKVESLDKRLFSDDSRQNLLEPIHRLKSDAMRLHRTLLPICDVLRRLTRGEFSLFSDNIHVYLLDVYDHGQQLMETLNGDRDTVTGMMDIHLSFQSNRLNKQMRMLTVITIIFMPLTVITGIYGMNFDNMPELHWHYGYYVVLALMLTIVSSLLLFFYRRHWL